jgi:Ca-activated chloride channel family protein
LSPEGEVRGWIRQRPYGIFLPLTCALIALPLVAQRPAQVPKSSAVAAFPDKQKPADRPIKVDVDLVLVNVTVTDPYNRLVTGLEQDHFRVFEDNIEQEVQHFSSEDIPVSIGLIFDMSGSMGYKVDKARLAALQFVKTANPQDEFFLIGFNDRAQMISRFTSSVEELQSRLMYMTSKGRTALLDAIYYGLAEMKGARNTKKALLILSDGGDNRSRYNERDIRNFVKEADVQLYAIGIYEPFGSRGQPELMNGPTLLNDLTEMTGGRAFNVESLNDLPDIATKISMELRNQYVVGYKPSNADRDGKWRKIRVRVRPQKGLPPLNVYSRTGYYAPKH